MTKDRKSAELFYLTNAHLPTGHTPSSIINLLSNLAEKAEHGELRGIAVAWVEGDGQAWTQIAEGCAGSNDIVAAVSALFYDINSKWARK